MLLVKLVSRSAARIMHGGVGDGPCVLGDIIPMAGWFSFMLVNVLAIVFHSL